MNKITIPPSYNYIGVFLTFGCNLKCSYCINNYNSRPKSKQMSADDWIKGLNRIRTREDLPITLQGGEPTLYPGFYDIVNNVDKSINIDVLTNAQFNIDTFISKVDKDRMKRKSKYASIRVSYHCETMSLFNTIRKVKLLQDYGYSVGIWSVEHPKDSALIRVAKSIAESEGIDFRIKQFLGYYNGKMYGTYKYPEAVDGNKKKCMCTPSELLIDPSGNIYRCHYELYNGINSYAHILDLIVPLPTTHKYCDTMGLCNPCDVKLKTNRYQIEGHCSVSIKALDK